MIMSGQMLFAWLGRKRNEPKAIEAARRIEVAVEQVIADGKDLTPDLGGKGGTKEMGDAIVAAL
jgi:3-isopropylmalate dehydrogenase